MKAFIVVATKGRAKETYVLLDYLQQQTKAPVHIVVVGSEARDVDGLATHPSTIAGQTSIILASAGLTIQRNAGLDALQVHTAGLAPEDWFVTFYDDDFRPAQDWVASAAVALSDDRQLVGITGNVLADGVGSEFGVSEPDALDYLSGKKAAEPHWASATQITPQTGLYGCNMAYRGTVASALRFDENLPMYGWQEDFDYSSRARQFGHLILLPSCQGVHLGVSTGRTSGVRFGYSQIANPIFLLRKGTMSWKSALRLMSRNVLANIFKSLLRVRIKDFPGRLRGNLIASRDLLSGNLHPLRAHDI